MRSGRRPTSGAPRRSAQVLGAVRSGEERRLVSVVFVELSPVGLGAQADPEDLRELIGVGLAEAISEAEQFGGTVASVSGSGMSVLFGAPQSHEDDPERALRAALRIVGAVGRAPGSTGNAALGAGASLTALQRWSVGPHRGGDGRSGGGAGRRAGGRRATGRSARSSAPPPPSSRSPGPARCSSARPPVPPPKGSSSGDRARTWPSPRAPSRCRRATLCGRGRARSPRPGAGAWRPRPRSSAGRPSWRCSPRPCGRRCSATAGPSSSSVSRGSARHASSAECRKYFMGWVGAASGRLPLWLEGRCASYASSTPYGAYQQLLCRFIGRPARRAARRCSARPSIGAVHAVLGQDAEVVPVLARMMGLPPGPGGAHLGRMGPAELQHAMFSAVRSLLSRLVEHGPTVLALEDLHWSDPTSLRLTGELATPRRRPARSWCWRRAGPSRTRGWASWRPSWPPTPLAASRSCSWRLSQSPPSGPWPARCSGARSATRCSSVVCDGVDGNPLFLEERLASMLDTGALDRDGAGWRLGESDAAPVPEALERLVRSRADRLSPASREAMVAASVLGEDVERSALGGGERTRR